MRTLIRIGITAVVGILFVAPTLAAPADLRDSLLPGEIAGVRIHLNPSGAHLGFETWVDGDDPRIGPLLDVIHEAGPGEGHKCPNTGAVRFTMNDGRSIGVGLLPGHTTGVLEVRLYDGERFVGVYRVDRLALLAALGEFGVPIDDPALGE